MRVAEVTEKNINKFMKSYEKACAEYEKNGEISDNEKNSYIFNRTYELFRGMK